MFELVGSVKIERRSVAFPDFEFYQLGTLAAQEIDTASKQEFPEPLAAVRFVDSQILDVADESPAISDTVGDDVAVDSVVSSDEKARLAEILFERPERPRLWEGVCFDPVDSEEVGSLRWPNRNCGTIVRRCRRHVHRYAIATDMCTGRAGSGESPQAKQFKSLDIQEIDMSSNLYAQFTGTPMDSDDVDTLLTSEGYGILSLCRDGEPYSIPVSFGYDGDDIYFPFLIQSDDSKKTEFIAEGARARLLVTDIRGRFDWQSVAVTGPVHAIDPQSEPYEQFIETLVDNGWFMRSFERSDAISSMQAWRLEIDELQGLQRKEEQLE